jgi:hypothetical protein
MSVKKRSKVCEKGVDRCHFPELEEALLQKLLSMRQLRWGYRIWGVYKTTESQRV